MYRLLDLEADRERNNFLLLGFPSLVITCPSCLTMGTPPELCKVFLKGTCGIWGVL